MAILGPTAAGKTALSVAVAEHLGAEVISVDSMQVYRGMDIGTAKPSMEERRGIRHHMVDVVDADEEFSVSLFQDMGREIIAGAEAPLVITGGSGLHFRALVDPMSFAPSDPTVRHELESIEPAELSAFLAKIDPGAGQHVDLSNPRRVLRAVEVYRLTGQTPSARAATSEAAQLREYQSAMEFRAIGVDPGEALFSRIAERLAGMHDAGLVEEVSGLWATMGRNARSAVGYREIGAYLDGRTTLEEALGEVARSTRKLARRQRTWFQRDPRIRWIPWSDKPEERLDSVMEALS